MNRINRAGIAKRTSCLLTVMLIVVGTWRPDDAAAWDGKRKGFALGFTAGRGVSYLNSSGRNRSYTFGYDYRTRSITSVDWLVGYGPSDRLLLAFGVTSHSNSLAALTFNGTYFMKPNARSWFVEGRGVIVGDTPSSGTSDGVYGASGGFGYEFTPHWMVVTDLLYMRASRSASTFFYRQNVFSWRIVVRLLGYCASNYPIFESVESISVESNTPPYTCSSMNLMQSDSRSPSYSAASMLLISSDQFRHRSPLGSRFTISSETDSGVLAKA